jgi:hypothetical protein
MGRSYPELYLFAATEKYDIADGVELLYVLVILERICVSGASGRQSSPPATSDF